VPANPARADASLRAAQCLWPLPPNLLHVPHACVQAAAVLGLRPLAAYCQSRLGQLSDSLRLWHFDEVKVRAAA